MYLCFVTILVICLADGSNSKAISGNRRKPAEAAFGYNTMFGDQDETGNFFWRLATWLTVIYGVFFKMQSPRSIAGARN